MSNTFVKSTLILTIATLVSKILGSIFRIPLQNIAGDEVLGIFTFVYPVYMVALTLSVAGIPIAISKLISEARAKKDESGIRDIFVTAGILALLFGIASFSIVYSFSGQLADILGGPQTKLALNIVTLTLLVAPYMAVYRGFFQGFDDMRPTALSQVLEQFIRVALVLGAAYVLVMQGRSVEVVSGGVMVGSSIGALAALVYLRFLFVKSSFRPKAPDAFSFVKFKRVAGTILKISLPICIGAITMALLNFVDSMTIPSSLRALGKDGGEINLLSGIYGRGLALVQIATVVSTSIVLPLIPLITGALARGERNKAKDVIARAHSLAHFVSWPAAFGLVALTLPINLALFTDLQGSMVLAIISFSSLFTSLTVLGTGVLQGMNKSKLAAWIIIAGVIVKYILNIALINRFELAGAAWSTVIVYILLFFANTFFIWKGTGYSIWKRETFVFAFASIVMAAVVGVPALLFDIENWDRFTALLYTGIAIVIGGAIYAGLVLAMKGLDPRLLASLPFVGKYFKQNEKQSVKPINAPKGRKVAVKKWLWIILALSLLMTVPSIIERSKTEWHNRTYELIIPYEDIQDLLNEDQNMELSGVLKELKDGGLNSISLEPETLKSLASKGSVSVMSSKEMKNLFILGGLDQAENGLPTEEGLFVYAEENPIFKGKIETAYKDSRLVEIQGNPFYFIPGKESTINDTPIGYNAEVMAEIKAQGFDLIPRLPNMKIEEENELLIDQLLNMKDDQTSRILYSGGSVTGFPERNHLLDWTNSLYDKGYTTFGIEFADQKGFSTVANLMDFNIIRLHSINLKQETPQVNVDRVVRAVKERNIKAIFMRMPLTGKSEEDLEKTVDFIKDVQSEMPTLFHNGIAGHFEKIDVPLWQKAFGLLAAIAFAGLAAVKVTKNRLVMWVALAGMTAVSLLYVATGVSILVKAVALAIAVAAPVFAVVPKMTIRNTKDIIVEYGMATLIALVGVWIVVVLLNGNQFLVNVELFKGVKLVYIIPIGFMLLYAFWGMVGKLLGISIRYWHAAVIFVIAIVAAYYISRTGNQGSVSSIELQARQMLEQLLYVRPRTKEFLIGFPIYVLALYVSIKYRKAAMFLLVPGVIGFLSLVNTFTHLHIPLYVSALRSAYSIVLGLIIGLILIAIYKLVMKYYKPVYQKSIGFYKYAEERWKD